jgi:hypothetical protein
VGVPLPGLGSTGCGNDGYVRGERAQTIDTTSRKQADAMTPARVVAILAD